MQASDTRPIPQDYGNFASSSTSARTRRYRADYWLTQEALRLRCVGALGAAEAIAAELNRGRATVAEAIVALTDLTVGSIDASYVTVP